MELSVKEMLEILDAPLVGKLSRLAVRKVRISMDSRHIRPGEIFWALKGERFDAHDFISQVTKRGALMSIVDKSWTEKNGELVRVHVPVGDTNKALLRLAQGYARKYSIPKVAITGSNGKTTTKEMLRAILSARHNVLSTNGNFNNLVGTPLTLLRLQKDHSCAVVEIGTNCPGEIETLSKVVAPGVAVITNVGASHLEGLHSLENIHKEKLSIVKGLKKGGTLFVNADDTRLGRLRSTVRYKVSTFGVRHGQLKPEDVKWDSDACASFRIGRTKFRLRVPGLHNLYNAMAAIAVGVHFKIPRSEISRALENFRAQGLRMEVREAAGFRMVADCYNANPASVRSALLTVGEMACPGRRIAVLGDMLELGEQAVDLHVEIGRMVNEAGMDWLFTVGETAKYLAGAAIQSGMARKHVFHFRDADKMFEKLSSVVESGDLLLVKASRGIGLEKTVDGLMDLQVTGEKNR